VKGSDLNIHHLARSENGKCAKPGVQSPRAKEKKLHPPCELMELLTKPIQNTTSQITTNLACAYLVDMSRKWRP